MRRIGGFVVGIGAALALSACGEGEGGRGGAGRSLGDDGHIRSLDADLDLREGVVDLPEAGEVEILYAVIDDRAIWTGDVLLGDPDELDSGFRAASLTASLWPNGTVKYVYDGSLPESYKPGLESAMQEWTDRTGVRFVAASEAEQSAGGILRVTGNQDGCFAHMGVPAAGTEHQLNLGPDCDAKRVHVHELGHVLGLFHEQSRADRDDHVVIHWDNVQAGLAYAFDQYTQTGQSGEDRGGYDFDSVMHYGSDAFAVDASKPTIERKGGGLIAWQEGISAGDAAAVSAMYAGMMNPEDNPADDPDGNPAGAMPGSCAGQCGSDQGVATADGGSCYCDAGCAEYGDCCADKDAACGAGGEDPAGPAGSAPSCSGKCGGSDPQADDSGVNCYCDDACTGNGDCCSDYAAQCGGGGGDDGGAGDDGGENPPSGGSCVGYCGGAGSQGESCYCDDQCTSSGDCCSDYASSCGGGGDDGGAGGDDGGGGAGSCAGYCGSSTDAGGCFCDPTCAEYGDCCPDYGTYC
jgi:hypothetical protein